MSSRITLPAGEDLGVFSVTDYGAVGDGVTDDLPAIIRAQAAMIAAGASTLVFPNPSVSYYVNGSIPGGPNDICYMGAGPSRGRNSVAPSNRHVLVGNGVDPVWSLVGTSAQNRQVIFAYLSASNAGAPVIDADGAHNGHVFDCTFQSTSLAGDLTGTIKLRRGPRWTIGGKSMITCSGGGWALSARDNCNGLNVEESVIMTGGSAGGACDVGQSQSVRLAAIIETSKFGYRIGGAGTDGGICEDVRIEGYIENSEQPISVGGGDDGAGGFTLGFATRGVSIRARIANSNTTFTPKFCVRLARALAWTIDGSVFYRKTGGTEPVVLAEYSASSPFWPSGGRFINNWWTGGPGDTTDVIKTGTTFPSAGYANRLIGENELQPVMAGPTSGIREWVSPAISPATGKASSAIFPVSAWGGKIEYVDIIEASGTLGCTLDLGTPASATELYSVDPSTLTLVNGGVRVSVGTYWRITAGTNYPLLLRVTAGLGTGSFRVRVGVRTI